MFTMKELGMITTLMCLKDSEDELRIAGAQLMQYLEKQGIDQDQFFKEVDALTCAEDGIKEFQEVFSKLEGVFGE